MHCNRTGRYALPLALSLLVALAGQTSALSLKATNWAELRQTADAVIGGTVKALRMERNDEPNGHGVQTRLLLENAFQLAGPAKLAHFDVLLPGGELDGVKVDVPGAPKFTPGERIVLLVRTLGGGELALAGHGLGVLRRSPENGWLKPDIAVENGPSAEGESLAAFCQRLGVNVPATGTLAFQPATRPSQDAVVVQPGGIGLALALCGGGILLALLAWFFWRHRLNQQVRTLPLLALGAGLLTSVYAWRNPANAASVSSRAYVLSGNKWDLSTNLLGRVEAGRVLWWAGHGTPDLSDDVAFGVIQASFQQWEDIPASAIAFRKAGTTPQSGSAFDQRNVISFLQKVPRKSFDKLTLAVTFLISQSGSFLDADMAFNNQDQTWQASGGLYSLDVVSLHEAGHVVGLDHSPDPQDVMYPTANGLTVLSADDKAGAAAIYPVNPAALPLAFASVSPAFGPAPLNVSFSGADSSSPSGSALSYAWDFGDGTTSTEVSPTHTYAATGTFTATLTIADANGSAAASVSILAGSGSPAMTIQKFSYTTNLALPLNSAHGRDRLNLQLGSVNLGSGDSLQISVNGINLSPTTTGSLALGPSLTFKGPVSGGGLLAVKYTPSKQTLAVNVSSANFGILLDPRTTDLAVLSGTAPLRIDLIAIHTGGGMSGQSVGATYSYVVRAGQSSSGFTEKSIQGKL